MTLEKLLQRNSLARTPWNHRMSISEPFGAGEHAMYLGHNSRADPRYRYVKNGHKKRKGGHLTSINSALSALSLLAFLFFLNILQTSMRDNNMVQSPNTMEMLVVPIRGQKNNDEPAIADIKNPWKIRTPSDQDKNDAFTEK